VPRFRLYTNDPHDRGFLSASTAPGDAGVEDDYDFDDQLDAEISSRRRTPRRRTGGAPETPRLVSEGKSGRVSPDVDLADDVSGEPDLAPFSSYDVANHGPEPVPDWVITSFSARDTTLGSLKSGKEADVSVLDRSIPGGPGCLLAVKTYRDSRHRMFHRDSGYKEGRRVRRSRESRAMAARTAFGRELLSAKWASAEFAVLSSLWKAGARVPYPVQILGSELMMEFIGEPDAVAAPRLSAWEGDTGDFTELWHDLVASLEILAHEGLTHGDLSPYNVLVHQGQCVVIDLPQAVDVIANPQGDAFLTRDCQVIASFFARRGVLAADGELLALHLGGIARG
jgi:RIO kinase 1